MQSLILSWVRFRSKSTHIGHWLTSRTLLPSPEMRSSRRPEVQGVLNFKWHSPWLAIVLIALSLFGCAKQPEAVSPSPSPASPSSSPEVSPEAKATALEIDEGVDLALKSRDPKQLKMVLDSGASPHGGLDAAIYLDNAEMASLLLDYGADPNESDSTGSTALMTATFFGRSEIMRILLEKGAKPNVQGPDGTTALNIACYSEGQASILRLLLDSKADPNLANEQGMAALHYASLMGDAEMVKLLLDSKAQIEATTTPEGVTPLMFAAMEEDEGLESLQLLLKAGADIGARDKEGKTALLWAKDQDSKKCEEVLRKAAKQGTSTP